MRRGEVLGLRWRDVDFDLGQIAVAHTITDRRRRDRDGAAEDCEESRATSTWTGGRWLRYEATGTHQREQRLAAGPAWDNPLDLVVTDELGQALHPDYFSRDFDRLVRKLDVPRIRMHDLRHTHATLALKAGVHPKVVSERLGHATVGVTLDLYSHVMPAIAKEAAETIMSSAYDPADSVDD